MKRFIIALITVIAAAAVCSVAAFADDTVSGAPAAPSKVYYHLINHDKVEIKWGKIAGADSYYVYKLDAETGEFKLWKKTSKCVLTLKKLASNTEYTYAVSSMKKSGDAFYESEKSLVTFTTPEKWYYFVDSESFTDEINHYSHRYVYRQHYDGSGRENFDIYKLISEYENLEEYPYSGYEYGVDRIEQHFGYVYIKTTYYDIIDASEYDYFRMTNDGTEIISFGGSEYSGMKQYHYSADKSFCGSSTHFDGGMAACLTNSSVWVEFLSGDKAKYGMILRKPMSNISNFAADDKYAYFITSPYLDTDHVEEDDSADLERRAYVYRVSLDDPTEEQVKNRTELGEIIADFDYSFTDDGIIVLGCNDGYLYFMICEEGEYREMRKYGFYRISTVKEEPAVEKLCTKKMFVLCDVELKDDTIWFFGYSSENNKSAKKLSAYRIETKAEKVSSKCFFTITSDSAMFDLDFYKLRDEDNVKITDDFIYIDFRNSYCRVNIAKKTVKSSKTPFIWR